MKKDLSYYMNLQYKMEVVEVTEEEGGGIVLFLPELGRCSTTAWGETFEEAKAELEDIKQDLFTRCLEECLTIPEPKSEELQDYSGKLLLRMPKMMHKAIANMAEENSISINSCILQLITKGLTQEEMCQQITDRVEEGINKAIDSWPIKTQIIKVEREERPTKADLALWQNHLAEGA